MVLSQPHFLNPLWNSRGKSAKAIKRLPACLNKKKKSKFFFENTYPSKSMVLITILRSYLARNFFLETVSSEALYMEKNARKSLVLSGKITAFSSWHQTWSFWCQKLIMDRFTKKKFSVNHISRIRYEILAENPLWRSSDSQLAPLKNN
jgi:hypothetical protein